MKIAILLLSGGVVNRGAEHGMLQLAEDLTFLGHQVTVFQSGNAQSGATYLVKKINIGFQTSSHKPISLPGKILERLYLNGRGLLTLLFSVKLSKYLKSYDLIIPTDGFWQVMIAKIFKKSQAKIVTVGLAGIGWTDADTLKLNPDAFVALSTKAKNWAETINPKIKLATIPLQVDLKKYEEAKPKSLSLHSPVVLTVAALTAYKRVDLIIKSVSQIKYASLIIAGQGEEKSRLQALANQLLPNRHEIVNLGFDDLPSLYRSTDVFVLASKSQEAFGQVLVEAMAANLPIVTTNDPIRREIVGALGFYFNDAIEESLKKAIEKALKSGPIHYTHISRFDRMTVAKAYQELFMSLIN